MIDIKPGMVYRYEEDPLLKELNGSVCIVLEIIGRCGYYIDFIIYDMHINKVVEERYYYNEELNGFRVISKK